MAALQRFVRRSIYPVSVETLFDWHARPGAFERLSPPWQRTELLERSGGLETGARTVIRVWVGPVPQRWVAEHTGYEPGRMFQDTQREGPFAHWVHTHRMSPEGPRASALEDDLSYAPPLGALGQAVGGGYVRRTLDALFDYRHAVTGFDLSRHARYAERSRRRVGITGASGLIGSVLVPFLQGGGHEVVRFVRRAALTRDERTWAPTGEGGAPTLDPTLFEGLDAVIHLAGENVAGRRWDAEQKEAIRRSRVESTRRIAEALTRTRVPPKVLICASGTGVYGDTGERTVDESSQTETGDDFLASVVREWEAATEPAEKHGIRVVHARLGVVLDPRGGALAKLLPSFKAGAGSVVGTGKQWVPWVSLEDVVGALHAALFEPSLKGPVNVTAPSPVRYEALASTLGSVLRRPALLRVPGVALRLGFGEVASGLLGSARVRPGRLEAAGFPFVLPTLEPALRFALGRTG